MKALCKFMPYRWLTPFPSPVASNSGNDGSIPSGPSISSYAPELDDFGGQMEESAEEAEEMVSRGEEERKMRRERRGRKMTRGRARREKTYCLRRAERETGVPTGV